MRKTSPITEIITTNRLSKSNWNRNRKLLSTSTTTAAKTHYILKQKSPTSSALAECIVRL